MIKKYLPTKGLKITEEEKNSGTSFSHCKKMQKLEIDEKKHLSLWKIKRKENKTEKKNLKKQDLGSSL